MKKSIPVSASLNEYFSTPCPVLSDNNSQFILDEIAKGHEWIVEYGMGASTLYFLNAAQERKGTFISVENNHDWFEICTRQIGTQPGVQEIGRQSRPWSLCQMNRFINGLPGTDAPPEMLRFPHWRESMATGPFFRLSPQSKHRLGGKLGPAWPILKPFFMAGASALYALRPQSRPHNAEWRGQSGDLQLILRNVGPSVKDQYGETPNMMEYIDAGLREIRAALESGKSAKALFIIDGGPRHKIVEEILSLEDRFENFKPTIILCDAWRSFYHATLAKRPAGKFISGSNKTLKGEIVAPGSSGKAAQYWTNGEKTAEELAQQEIWYYSA